MRKRSHIFAPLGALLAVVTLAGCTATPNAETAGTTGPDAKSNSSTIGKIFESEKPVTLAEGTAISVVLDESLSSDANRAGEAFDATVTEPVIVDGKTVIAKHARAKGRVVDAERSGRLHSPARLEVELTSVEVSGKWYDISTSDNTRVGRNHNKRNLAYIGGGTAAGALIGGLAGGGKGALIGGALGAGGGTAAAAATGKMDIRLPAETHLTFRLVKPVTVQVKS